MVDDLQKLDGPDDESAAELSTISNVHLGLQDPAELLRQLQQLGVASDEAMKEGWSTISNVHGG